MTVYHEVSKMNEVTRQVTMAFCIGGSLTALCWMLMLLDYLKRSNKK